MVLKSKKKEVELMARRVALTTFDNPYDPIDDFNNWLLFDMRKGYNSCAYLDRIAKTSDSLSDRENEEEIERAIDEIVSNDIFNLYYKKVKEVQ